MIFKKCLYVYIGVVWEWAKSHFLRIDYYWNQRMSSLYDHVYISVSIATKGLTLTYIVYKIWCDLSSPRPRPNMNRSNYLSRLERWSSIDQRRGRWWSCAVFRLETKIRVHTGKSPQNWCSLSPGFGPSLQTRRSEDSSWLPQIHNSKTLTSPVYSLYTAS